MSQRDTLLGWLKDAHSMEKALLPVLENHADDSDFLPEVQARMKQHHEETQRHADRVEECIKSLGEDTSAVKDAVGNVTGFMNSVTSAPYADEPVKNMLQDYAAENFEVACYTSLIAAANELGEAQVAAVCEEIMREDEAMAQWIEEQIPLVTTSFLGQQASAEDS